MKQSMKSAICAMNLALLLSAATFSSAQPRPARQNSPFEFEPWVTAVTENSFVVAFKTMEPAMCWVEIAPDDGTAWYQTTRPKYHYDINGRHFCGTFHKVTVNGLTPGQKYRYRVFGKTLLDKGDAYHLRFRDTFRWSAPWGETAVRTLDSKASRCLISVVNDIHFNDDTFSALASGMPEEADFLVLNGDIVSFCMDIDTVLRHTLSPIAKAVSTHPVFYARGNHETRGADWYKFSEVFPSTTGEFYYTLRQGPLGIIVLDAGEDKPDSDIEYSGTAAFDAYRQEELEWLKQAVQSPAFAEAPVKICIMHVPTISTPESWYGQKWISDNFAPVLEKAGVKLLVGAHHHSYKFLRPGTAGVGYTIMVNSNKERLDLSCDGKKINLKTYDIQGKLTHEETVE